MPHLEEISNAYSVNSEEIYSLQITKTGDMTILSQADKLSEGATTIDLSKKNKHGLPCKKQS